MTRILPDGLDCYVILRDDAVLGWINFSRWHGKWRALSVKNQVTFHRMRASAIEAVGG
jgi:hypothetical protein